MSEHTAKAFDADLQELTRMVAEMGGLAEKQVADAIDALVNATPTARSAPSPPISPSTRCSATSRKRPCSPSPAGSRWRSTCARSSGRCEANDLERIGDLAKNIGKRVLALDSEFHPPKLIRGVEHMAALVLAQLKEVLDSYARHDLKKAMVCGRATRRSTPCAPRCSASC